MSNKRRSRPKPPPIEARALPELNLDEPFDPRTIDLTPDVDNLADLEAPDPLLTYYLSLARAHGIVYALDIKWLLDKLYRYHDYLQRYQRRSNKRSYDQLLLRDLKALAWLIAAAMRYVPDEVKEQPIPPPPLAVNRRQPNRRTIQQLEREGRQARPGEQVRSKAAQLRAARTLLVQQLEAAQAPREQRQE
jgi:hypothetical protein